MGNGVTAVSVGVVAEAQAVSCLRLEQVSKRFGRLQVLENISLSVQPGERRGIIGPNGAGKTTLFNIIAGEFPLSSGTVSLFGHDITHLPNHRRAGLGLCRTFQITNLFPRLTAQDNVVLALQALSPVRWQPLVPRSANREIAAQAMRLLEQIGLADRADTPVKSLSHGEQRQIEILLALAQKPRLLLLDEPMAGLAPGDAPLITGMLKRLGRDVTIVLIEHDMSVVFELVDRITVLHYGQAVAEGTPMEIRENPLVQEIYLGGRL